jgi:predicted SprT family Zn-dependent metalloprotease
MSYKDCHFLFWRWKDHEHEWVEEDRQSYRTVRRYIGHPEVPDVIKDVTTRFLYRCSECGEREVREIKGDWVKGERLD